MLKIWGRANSTNVKKVLWCVEELGLDYERIDAGGAFGLVDDPAYRHLNPNGLVPTLQDGDLVLWESNAIVRYLADAYGGGELRADDPAARASAEKWMDWTSTSIAGPFRDLFWNVVRRSPEQRNEEELRSGRKRSGELLAIADAALAQQPYLSGETFGVGDIPLGCFAYAWFEMPIERPDMPALRAWYDRLRQRQPYQKAVMTPLT